MRIDGILRRSKKTYRFHIERSDPRSQAKGINGGRILAFDLYENDTLVVSYKNGWKKSSLNKNAKELSQKLIRQYSN